MKGVWTIVQDVLTRHYSALSDTVEHCIDKVAGEMYSKELISRAVRNSPEYRTIHDEFVAGMKLKRDLLSLEKYCQHFLDSLDAVGGPVQLAANLLCTNWKEEVKKSQNVSFSLTTNNEDLSSKEPKILKKIVLNSKSEVSQGLCSLQKQFISLLKDIRKYYDECGLYKVIDVARWMSEYFRKSGFVHLQTIDDLFDAIQPHYDFLNIEVIQDLSEEFVLSEKLQSAIEKYESELAKFEESVEIQDMKAQIEKVSVPIESANCRILIRLTGRWRCKTVENLRKLVKYLFEKNSKHFRLIDIDEGSVIVVFFAPSSVVQSIIDHIINKTTFLHHLGIFKIFVDDKIIFDVEEDLDFSFEGSLIDAIKCINSGKEYERIAFLLIDLKVNIKYQNIKGETALLVASEHGLINIFMALVLNGADMIVQLPSEEYIGLNYLACTALSKHMHTTIGEDRTNILKDSASVFELFDNAIKERRIAWYLYKPFVLLVAAKLEERFQKLSNDFEELCSKFVAITSDNEVLLSKMRGAFDFCTDTESNFLEQLQSYYSCFNIRVLIRCGAVIDNHDFLNLVESYSSKLTKFKDTTTLAELAVATEKELVQHLSMHKGFSKLKIIFGKNWGSMILSNFLKFESIPSLSTAAHSLNLLKVSAHKHNKFVCFFLIPHSQTQAIFEIEQELLEGDFDIDEIFIDDAPIVIINKEKISARNILDAREDNPRIQLIERRNHLEDEHSNMTREGQLLDNIKQGQINAIRHFLSDGNCNMNYINDEGESFLMVAVRSGNCDIFQILLEKTSNVNARNRQGNTALIIACEEEQHKMIELLLENNANLNIRNNIGMTALMSACLYGLYLVVELLLEEDPQLDIQNEEGMTALIACCSANHHDVAELLLSRNPNVNIQNGEGVSALMFASFNGDIKITDLLLSKSPDLNLQNNDGQTSLMLACDKGHHNVVEHLLRNDPGIDIQDNEGMTALMFACMGGHHNVVELLLMNNPTISINDDEGWTALEYAIDNGHDSIAELLLPDLKKSVPDINYEAILYSEQNF